MAPKRKAELMRESRKRKRDNELRYSDEFFLFIRDTPFCSNTTDSEKFEAFLRLRDSNAPKPASNAEKCKKYREVDKLRKRDARLKNKLKIVIPITEPPRNVCIDEFPVADNEFNFRFIQNKFGVSCAVCDRLWFEKDMKHVPQKAVDFLLEKYPDLDSHNMSVCNTCYKTLLSNKVPRFATINGFCHPPFKNLNKNLEKCILNK